MLTEDSIRDGTELAGPLSERRVGYGPRVSDLLVPHTCELENAPDPNSRHASYAAEEGLTQDGQEYTRQYRPNATRVTDVSNHSAAFCAVIEDG